jgi:hypothetical protein
MVLETSVPPSSNHLTRMVLETSIYSPFNYLTRLLARESLTEFSRYDSFTLQIRVQRPDIDHPFRHKAYFISGRREHLVI